MSLHRHFALHTCLHSASWTLGRMQSSVRSLARTIAVNATPRIRTAAIPSWSGSLSSLPSSSRAFPPLGRSFATSCSRRDDAAATRVPVNAERGTPIGKVVDRRLRIVFTCTAPKSQDEPDSAAACGHRSSHEFSRSSYEKGVVIVQCPECSNRHLIGCVSSFSFVSRGFSSFHTR